MIRNGIPVDLDKSREWQRTAAERYARTAVRRPVRRQSRKRAAAARIYAARRKTFLAANRTCAGLAWVEVTGVACERQSSQVHHKAGRVGSLFLDESRWAAVCGPCHEWATTHPADAIQLGLSEPRIGAAT